MAEFSDDAVFLLTYYFMFEKLPEFALTSELSLSSHSSELAQLRDRLSNMNSMFWIGLNDKERVGFYQWVDGSPVTFTNWDYNQPGLFSLVPKKIM